MSTSSHALSVKRRAHSTMVSQSLEDGDLDILAHGKLRSSFKATYAQGLSQLEAGQDQMTSRTTSEW